MSILSFMCKILPKNFWELSLMWRRRSVTRFGNLLDFLKPLAAIILPKSPTFLGNYCRGVKIYHFSIETIFGQPL